MDCMHDREIVAAFISSSYSAANTKLSGSDVGTSSRTSGSLTDVGRALV